MLDANKSKDRSQNTGETASPAAVEVTIKSALQDGDVNGAATLAIQTYGGEILGFLLGRLRSEHDASDVFADFSLDLLHGLPGFRWRTSLRSWLYTLARNAATRYQLRPQHRSERNVKLPSSSEFNLAVAELRSTTKVYLQTEIKTKMRALRERLSQDEQSLLVLRIDKEMSWNEIAAVLSGRGEELDEAELKRWAARLRQRYHKVKRRLRQLAEEEGLL